MTAARRLFQGRHAPCDLLVAARPRSHGCLELNAAGIGGRLDDSRPAGGGAGGGLVDYEGIEFTLLPVGQCLIEQILPVAEMPVEAALADVKIASEHFDANRIDAGLGQFGESGANPVVGLKRRCLCESGCSGHTLAYVDRDGRRKQAARSRTQSAGGKPCQRNLQGGRLDAGIVAEAREPFDALLSAEPGDLALGKLARRLLDLRGSRHLSRGYLRRRLAVRHSR